MPQFPDIVFVELLDQANLNRGRICVRIFLHVEADL